MVQNKGEVLSGGRGRKRPIHRVEIDEVKLNREAILQESKHNNERQCSKSIS
jgi:hypothetical protein